MFIKIVKCWYFPLQFTLKKTTKNNIKKLGTNLKYQLEKICFFKKKITFQSVYFFCTFYVPT